MKPSILLTIICKPLTAGKKFTTSCKLVTSRVFHNQSTGMMILVRNLSDFHKVGARNCHIGKNNRRYHASFVF